MGSPVTWTATTATLGPWMTFAIAVVVAVVSALVLTTIVSGIVKLALRRRDMPILHENSCK